MKVVPELDNVIPTDSEPALRQRDHQDGNDHQDHGVRDEIVVP